MTARDQRGAVLIHVAFGLLALTAFTTFAVDYGVLWVARGQAQNAADAGALAGAIALGFDGPDRTNDGPAKQAAWRVASGHAIWGEAPDVRIASDVTFPTCPDGRSDCIRVDVYRTPARGNALPMYFGPLLGLTEQGVRATATAQALASNASDCMKPWAMPDKWIEQHPEPAPWSADVEFDLYDKKGNPLPTPDIYEPPTAESTGTGFTIEADYGTRLTLKPGNPQDAISPGWFLAVVLPRTDGSAEPGGQRYRDNIASCNGQAIAIGTTLETEPGNMVGPTRQGVEDLIALDPAASWDPAANAGHGAVAGGCMGAGTCAMSPRMVALPVFDTGAYAEGKQGGRIEVRIVNILGLFIEGLQGNDVIGYLTHYPALVAEGGTEIVEEAAFARTIVLVR